MGWESLSDMCTIKAPIYIPKLYRNNELTRYFDTILYYKLYMQFLLDWSLGKHDKREEENL